MGIFAVLLVMAPSPECQSEDDVGPRALVEYLELEYRQVVTGNAPRSRLREVLAEHVDFHDVARESLDGQWDQLTSRQQRRFSTRFQELLVVRAVTAARSADFDLVIEEVTWAPPFVGVKTRLRVGVRAPAIVVINLHHDGERCRVVDVVVEGRSVVREYREQFGRILDQHGWADLIRRIDNAIATMNSNP